MFNSCKVSLYAGVRSYCRAPRMRTWGELLARLTALVGRPTGNRTLELFLSDKSDRISSKIRNLMLPTHPILNNDGEWEELRGIGGKLALLSSKLYPTANLHFANQSMIQKALAKTTKGESDQPVQIRKLIQPKHRSTDEIKNDEFKKKLLAECLDLIQLALEIHRKDLKEANDPKDRTFAILCGDLVMASAVRQLASLEVPKVMEKIMSATSDSCVATVMPAGDWNIPELKKQWHERTKMEIGHLYEQAFASIMLLDGHTDEKLINDVGVFGRRVAFAVQSSLHVRREKVARETILKLQHSMEDPFKYVPQRTPCEVLQDYVEEAKNALKAIPVASDSTARFLFLDILDKLNTADLGKIGDRGDGTKPTSTS